MRIIVLLGLFMATACYAEPPVIKANCQDVKLSINTVQKNRFNFGAYWNEPAVFPNPPTYVQIGDKTYDKAKDILKFKINCDDFTASYDGNIAEVKASNYDVVLEKIGKYDKEINLYSRTGYKYPNIKEGFWSTGYSFDLESFKLKSNGLSMDEGDDLSSKIATFGSVDKSAMIGYKIDGGELKPLLYDKKVSFYLDDLKKANIIEIFHSNVGNEDAVTIQKIFIDKKNGTLRIFRKFPFPK